MAIFDADLNEAVGKTLARKVDGLVLGYTLVVNYLPSDGGEERIKMAAPEDQRPHTTASLAFLGSQIADELVSRTIETMLGED